MTSYFEPAELPDEAETARLQEQFVAQTEDDSLPAMQVLTEQKQGLEPDTQAPLFIP